MCVLFIMHIGTPSGERKNMDYMHSLDKGEDMREMVDPEGREIALQRKCEYDGYEGVAHSFRQTYFRD